MTRAARSWTAAAVLLIAAACGGGGVATPSPSRPGPHLGTTDGCPPSFWAKPENFQRWEELRPDAVVGVFFPEPEQYAEMTLADALQATSASDVRWVLIQQAIAAMLNGAHESLGYPYSRYELGVDGRPPIVPTVADLLQTGTEDQMAAFARELREANELGCRLELIPTPP